MADDIGLQHTLAQGVLTITLNRPKANAFDRPMAQELTKVFRDAGRDEAVRVILLAAAGKLFSAGQDVGEFGGDRQVSFRQHLLQTYNPLILQMRRFEKPVLAAINGPVAGAALGIVLACDLRIAAQNAKFVVGFLGIGLAPDSAVSLLLPAMIGLGRATEATFTNQTIDSAQALAWGLVNRVVPAEDLPAAAATWAAELAAGPVGAMGLAKRDFNRAHLGHLEEILDYEAYNQDIAGRRPEHAEGLAAFNEKRSPRYL